jgi:hypothetical protein
MKTDNSSFEGVKQFGKNISKSKFYSGRN